MAARICFLLIVSTAYNAFCANREKIADEFLKIDLQKAGGTAVVLDRKTGNVDVVYNAALARNLKLAPGSVMKPFALTALLRSGKLAVAEKFRCSGNLKIDGRNLTCAHPVLPSPLGAEEAIAYSCNNFVAHAAERFAPGEFARYLQTYGFSSVTAADPRLQALGETGIMTTPLELARAYRKLADTAPKAVLAGMRGATEYGTAQLARIEGIPLWGKTGTVPHHAWFAGFTDSKVIVVLVQGHSGGSDAAPLARRILDTTYPAGPGVVSVRQWRLSLEDYVAGVLAGECKGFRSTEALKAMAVAARTYAVRFRGRHKEDGYDFCDTTHCQNLRLDAVTNRERDAASATAGEFLWFRGSPVETYYSKDCGGVTADAVDVWPDVSAPYLRQIRDPFCPRKSWDSVVDARKFAEVLRANNLNVPAHVTSVHVAAKSGSGRALRLAVEGDGRSSVISASAIRFALGRTLGWSTLRSDLYEVQSDGGRILFHGYGTGHGAGLCQLGSDAMAAAGKSYREILAFYYPDTKLGLTAQGLLWQRLGGERVDVFSTQPSKDGAIPVRADGLLRRAEEETGMRFDRRPMIRVYPTVAAFRDSTGEPGWVAGDARGRLIRLQPNPPVQTIYHELLHLVLEAHANSSIPAWFREEMAQYLAGDAAQTSRMRRLVARYGKAVVVGWMARGLPPELRNNNSSQDAIDKK